MGLWAANQPICDLRVSVWVESPASPEMRCGKIIKWDIQPRAIVGFTLVNRNKLGEYAII